MSADLSALGLLSPDDLTESHLFLAVVLYPGLKAALAQAQRNSTIEPRAGRACVKLIREETGLSEPSKEGAFNILLAAETLRVARLPAHRLPAGQLPEAQDFKAGELPEAHVDDGQAGGQAD